jgi:serine/threonine protein kinase
MTITSGTRLGRYEIRSRLVTSDTEEVYLARAVDIDRNVVLRIVSMGDPLVERDFRDVFAVAVLAHPNISAVYEVDSAKGFSFIVSEFIDGETLSERLRRGPLRRSDAVDIAIQVASALEEAHRHGIIHRDIKPDNIMLRRDGAVKVLDFGLARFLDRHVKNADASLHDTLSGVVYGTVAYMSPEQSLGERIDFRSDLWSLGVVLYQSLTGHLPFEDETVPSAISRILHESPPLVSDYLPHAPAGLQQVLTRALEKNPDKRYQSAQEFIRDLHRLKTDGFPDAPARRFSMPHPMFSTLAFVSLIALIILGLVSYFFRQPRKPDREGILRTQLGRATELAQQDLEQSFNSIKPMSVKRSDGTFANGYDGNAVMDVARSEQMRLTQDLSASEFVALRIYIIEKYPVPKPENLDKIAVVKGNFVISEQSKTGVQLANIAFIDKLSSLSQQGKLSINLTINSSPDQASYEMWASGAFHRTTSTNNSIDNVWRGLYKYSLTKSGYKPIEDSLNLVDSNGRVLNCQLNITSEQDGPHPCKLQ